MNLVKSQILINHSKLSGLSIKEIQQKLDGQMNELIECDKCGNYAKADELKISIEQLKKELNEKKLAQMVQNHKKELKKLLKDNLAQMDQLNDTWSIKIQDFNCQKDKLKKQMGSKHFQEIQNAKKELQLQISNKLKESSECLNFRKIEQQMKKQKKYSEAHQIQQRIAELQIIQKQSFDMQRLTKIRTALKALKNRQKTESQALNKKIQSGLKELEQEKQKQVDKLKLKHANSMKDLVSQQEKELLGEKGQIKSRVSLSIYRSPSKITRSSVSKKLI